MVTRRCLFAAALAFFTLQFSISAAHVSAATRMSFDSIASAPATSDRTELRQRIARGEAFLTNLFDVHLDLLPEFRGSRTCWLFHDNYLAAHLLEHSRPDLARRIRASLLRYGVTNSGKIEIVFGEARQPLPFRTYVLTNIAEIDGTRIRTEFVTTNILHEWDQYADLLLLAALTHASNAPAQARKEFMQANEMWDGEGFDDRAAEHSGIHATYKLALYLLAAKRLAFAAPHREETARLLLQLQAADGGWRTDYKKGEPRGRTNVETSCLALLALHALSD